MCYANRGRVGMIIRRARSQEVDDGGGRAGGGA